MVVCGFGDLDLDGWGCYIVETKTEVLSNSLSFVDNISLNKWIQISMDGWFSFPMSRSRNGVSMKHQVPSTKYQTTKYQAPGVWIGPCHTMKETPGLTLRIVLSRGHD